MNRANAQRRENPTHIKTESADEIPVVHRLAIIYLMLPVLIWLVGWFEWWLGVPAAVLLAFAFWQSIGPGRDSFSWEALSQAWRAVFRPTTVVVLLGAFAWVMTTAAGGVFDVSNADWIKHRALFLDLARGSWPVYHPYWLSELSVFFPEGAGLSGLLLRYYLGYYMVPGLVGKWFGISRVELGGTAMDVVWDCAHGAVVHARPFRPGR